ncbi:glutathione peroxidase [Rhizobium sullae]|uniref:Glutathione peroxidase n=1 Tax=Rhizobium sullae TaxID=50338 RepID=A0A4R3Q496_RHISU|nr:glutathione peroxidase [Rhizobium sullae]
MTDLSNVSAKLADGRETTLCECRGKVMLVVNVASTCGLTKQYDGLEKLYEDQRERGFVIAAFPAKGEGKHPLNQRLTTAGRSGKGRRPLRAGYHGRGSAAGVGDR